MSPERREGIEERVQTILISMALQELRQAHHLTQQEIADILNVNQAALRERQEKVNR